MGSLHHACDRVCSVPSSRLFSKLCEWNNKAYLEQLFVKQTKSLIPVDLCTACDGFCSCILSSLLVLGDKFLLFWNLVMLIPLGMKGSI